MVFALVVSVCVVIRFMSLELLFMYDANIANCDISGPFAMSHKIMIYVINCRLNV